MDIKIPACRTDQRVYLLVVWPTFYSILLVWPGLLQDVVCIGCSMCACSMRQISHSLSVSMRLYLYTIPLILNLSRGCTLMSHGVLMLHATQNCSVQGKAENGHRGCSRGAHRGAQQKGSNSVG